MPVLIFLAEPRFDFSVKGPCSIEKANGSQAAVAVHPRRRPLWEEQVLCHLPTEVAAILLTLSWETREQIEEIRLRSGQPLALGVEGRELFLNPRGNPTPRASEGYRVTTEQVAATWQRMARFSVYALEEELRQGFLTLAGGHRVGLAGRFLPEESRLGRVTSLNIRLAKELPGVAATVLPHLVEGGALLNTMIVSPPQGGKTTLLRDLIRQISTGVDRLGLPGLKVGVVDERSELAGSLDGVPQLDLGPRTDVLDAGPKTQGLWHILRSLSPQVIVTDELGGAAEAAALSEAARAGVRILATAHARDWSDIRNRAGFGCLREGNVFQRYVVLGNSLGRGTVETVHDGAGVCRCTGPWRLGVSDRTTGAAGGIRPVDRKGEVDFLCGN